MKIVNLFGKLNKLSIMGFTYAVSSLACATPVTTIGGLAGNVKGAYTSGAKILYAVAAIIGIMFIVSGLFKAKAHSYDVQGTSGHMKGAVSMLVIGGCLIAIPIIMMIGHNSFFGEQAGADAIALPSEASGISIT